MSSLLVIYFNFIFGMGQPIEIKTEFSFISTGIWQIPDLQTSKTF
jgi:hypothetical protein